jgi:hypothetical protein
MSPRKDPRKPRRPYHAFPWSPAAIAKAVELRASFKASFRWIALELFGLGLVDQVPNAATVRRMLTRESKSAAIGGGK